MSEIKGLRVILVGYGKMGQALVHGWLAEKGIDRLIVVDPRFQSTVSTDKRIDWHWQSEPPRMEDMPHVIVLAVKPQILASLLSVYQEFVSSQTLFVSIAAGKSLTWLREQLGSGAAIVRAMPNTPALIGCGMTVAIANTNTTQMHVSVAHRLFCAVGEVIWLEDESLMDAVTALSGSGPAYVFLLIETLARAGIAEGLPADLAMYLARQTVIGSAALAREDATSVEVLRQNVTSPGGTTEAALRVLMDQDSLNTLFARAIHAAAKRARELAM